MDNLEQRRAANALAKADYCRKGKGEGDCLSGFPGLIINNGLLACLAYSLDKQGQHDRVANAIAFHLHEMEIAERLGGGQADARWLLDYLVGRARNQQNQFIQVSAHTLRRATDEALAFLGYLKRFAKLPALTPAQP
jgi:CRISPR/Cas system CMR-associated protein Cmr5 small subunit